MRLANYDYRSTGAYAITICATDRHQELLKVPTLNSIIIEEWQRLPQRFVSVTLDILVIMPDHLHGIIWNNGKAENVKSIIDIIGDYKSLVIRTWLKHLKVTGENYPGKIWQKRFYDHIIRNEKDLHAQRTYMLNNPLKAKIKNEQKAEKHVCEYDSCGHIPFPPQ
jgi:putative transposase